MMENLFFLILSLSGLLLFTAWVVSKVVGQPKRASREWTLADGSRRFTARLVETREGWVRLETEDGRTIDLPATELSGEDQAFLHR